MRSNSRARAGVNLPLQTTHTSMLKNEGYIGHKLHSSHPYGTMERQPAFRFNTPSSVMVVGPSGCGKTVFTTKLLVDHPNLFETPPKKSSIVRGHSKTGSST